MRTKRISAARAISILEREIKALGVDAAVAEERGFRFVARARRQRIESLGRVLAARRLSQAS